MDVARGRGFDVRREAVEGGAVGVEWYVTPMVGVVAEYSASKISLRRERDDLAVNIRLNGPAAYLKVRF